MTGGKFERSELLAGEEAVRKFGKAKILLFGLGGVGSFVFEALLRSGALNLTVVDGDTVNESNFNRQLLADERTLDKWKAEAAKERAKIINEEAVIFSVAEYFTKDNADKIDFAQYDYVVDCIDTVSAKLIIAKKCNSSGTPVISCMGTGKKLNPQFLRVADISQTHNCPLARVMRRELKKAGIKKLKCVYSPEKSKIAAASACGRKQPVPSMIFVPAAAGLLIAAEVFRDITEKKLQITNDK